ncbi:hypothetical protein pb186bvf_012631 [Paramecium bursaria]
MIKNILKTYGYSLKFQQNRPAIQQISVLPSGIRIFTEQTSFPFHSDIGICFRAGLRNELPKEKGALFSLNQHMYHISENDCLDNFESTLRTGCMLEQIYDQEFTYWKCSFIQEDFAHIIDVILKLALTNKVISKETREQFRFFQEQNRLAPKPTPVEEVIRQAAFKDQPMGNSKHQHKILPDQQSFSSFQQEMLTPENLIIGYSGIWSHEQFRDFIERKLVDHQQFFQRQLRKQKKAVFVPNTFVETSSAKQDVDIAILFEGVEFSHPDLTKLHIINQIIGSSSSWSSGGPGKGMRSRSTLNLMQKIACVEQAGGVFQPFIDCGIFGMRVGGPQNTVKPLYECLVQEIRNLLIPMSDEEFERSKNISNTLIQINLEKQADKLEESVKNIFNRGTPNTQDYFKQVSQVNKDQIHETIRRVLFTPPTVMVTYYYLAQYYGQTRERIPDHKETSKLITQI